MAASAAVKNCAQLLPQCYSNPLVPAWRLPNFEAPKVNLNWKYAPLLPLQVPAGTTLYNQIIPMVGQADFLWRENAFDTGAASPGTIRIRFKDQQGKRMSHDLLAVEELEGPIPVTQFVSRSTQVFYDIQNVGTVNVNVQVILKGILAFEPLGINTCMPGFEPEEYIPLYQMYSLPPAGWHDEPYDYYFEIEAAASASQQGLPLQMDTDADFYARGITGYGTLDGLQKFRFIDAWQNQLSSGYVFQGNELGKAPQCRPIFPEIYCPAYATLSVDCIEYTGNPTVTKFALRGVKRFKNDQ
jgi:hypothetical protein